MILLLSFVTKIHKLVNTYSLSAFFCISVLLWHPVRFGYFALFRTCKQSRNSQKEKTWLALMMWLNVNFCVSACLCVPNWFSVVWRPVHKTNYYLMPFSIAFLSLSHSLATFVRHCRQLFIIYFLCGFCLRLLRSARCDCFYNTLFVCRYGFKIWSL